MKKTTHLLSISLAIALTFFFFFTSSAQCSTSDVTIDVISSPNFIEDSNVETPAGVRLRAAHIGVKITNTTGDTLVNVFAYVGNYTGSGTGTPGIYPSKTHPGLVGTFSLTHSASTSDATRFIGTLLPNESMVQYWMIEYPLFDNNGDAVFGGCSDETDDLNLDYDFWVSFSDDEAPATTCFNDETYNSTIRCQITASANKIWPNGDNKVPDEWVTALEASGLTIGWELDTVPATGAIGKSQGIWYDVGNVNKGFDNDGDFIPDYNAWLQPVGNPETFNPDCYRLVRASGVLLVNTRSQGWKAQAFEDKLYFQNIAEDNTGVVGYVIYEFITINGPCGSVLSPYQSAASGSNNEKFNADFGTTLEIESTASPAKIEKSVDSSFIDNPVTSADLAYTLKAINTGNEPMGSPDFGNPLIIREVIPEGTVYKSGSANLDSGSYSYTVLYSTDDGVTWVTVEPSPTSDIDEVEWWLNEPLEAGDTAFATLEIEVSSTYSGIYGNSILNQAYLSVGQSEPFSTDDASTIIRGTNTIGDTVFVDNGAGDGIIGDGIFNGDETVLSDVTILLYYDLDDNGVIDPTDVFYDSVNTDANGKYLFTNLPDGSFVVQVQASDITDNVLYPGYGLTTQKNIAVSLSGTESFLEADFGFAPALVMDKSLTIVGDGFEGETVNYDITTTNIFSSPGIAFSGDKTVWADAVTSTTFSKTPANSTYAEASIVGAPDGNLCGGLYLGTANSDQIVVQLSDISGSLKNVDTSTITSATARIYLSVDEIAYSDDGFSLNVYADDNNNGIFESGTDPTVNFDISTSSTPTTTTISEANNTYEITFDVTTLIQYGIDKIWYLRFSNVKEAGPDDSDEQWEIDAAGIEFNNDVETVSSLRTTLSPVPLTDSFDITELEYTGATPAPDSIDYTNGVLYWDNIGPIDAQASSTVNVSFKALSPTVNLDTFTNIAGITDARFLDGSDANDATDSARIAVEQRGSISGKLWSEGCSGTSGTYDDGTDGLISAITITLYGCIHDDGYLINTSSPSYQSNRACEANQVKGTWTLLETAQTDTSGEYIFDGLRNGFYYLAVSTVDISSPTQTEDPDATSDNQWNLPGGNLGTLNELLLNEDETNVDFGYTMDAIISGYVYEIVGNDTLPVEGVQLTLNPQGTTSSTTSDADGRYVIDGITSTGNYTIDTVLPSGATYSLVFSPETINVACVGEIVDNQNFGYNRSGTSNIGDTLFFDFDGDGIQDANEEGIDSVNVYIYKDVDEDGIFTFGVDIRVDSVMTDAGGAYLSNNLPSGEYLVVLDNNDPDFPTSSSYTYDPDESGICVVCDGISTVTLDGTTDDLDQDFGLRPIGDGVIGQYVWKDENGDSTKGTLEDGISGVIVYLYADLNNDGTFSLLDSVATDAQGLYTFDSLPDGSYKVNVELDDPQIPEEYINTNGNEYDVSITGGQTNNTTLSCSDCPTSMNFGFSTNATIGDFIYWDANGNGTSDVNEIGIPNVKVYLLNNLGVKIDSMLTADGTGTTPAGFYKFIDLPPGTYSIQVDDTDPNIGGASQTADPDSDGLTCGSADLIAFGYPPCDNTFEEELIYGSKVISADFGYDPPATFGDYIWNDINGDGVIDNGEPPIEGVTLYLCSSSSPCTPASGDFVDSAVTDYAGEYFFTNIANQSYTITVSEPAGYTFTRYSGNSSIPLVMAGDTIQSINGAACSDCSLDVDFGLNLSGDNTINGNICIDDGTNDGVCDGTVGETDLDSILVYLYKKEGSGYIEFGTTYTSSSGAYTFTDLPNEDYVVSISKNGNPFIEVSDLTTTDADAPSGDIVETTNSIYHNDITLSGNTTVNDVDFAFELPDMDFGDLSADYNVNIDENGPRHIIDSDWKLGLLLDGESNGNSSLRATGDDNDNTDDEDGITFTDAGTWDPSTTQCVTLSYTVPAGKTAHIVGWIDWGQDYSFVNDMVVDTLVSGTGSSVSICFEVPADVNEDSIYHNVRFRLFNEEQTLAQFTFDGLPQGDSLSGEVEDYAVDLMSATPVPVDLVYFRASKLADNHANLMWQTASELNSDKFEIYKSIDNGQSFNQIGAVPAANNSNRLLDYSYIDYKASKNASTCYRLRQVDFDGSYFWTNVACLNWESESISIYPNPANSEIFVDINEGDFATSIELLSPTGTIVFSKSEITSERIVIPTKDLSQGIYFIKVTNDNRVVTKRVLISH